MGIGEGNKKRHFGRFFVLLIVPEKYAKIDRNDIYLTFLAIIDG